MKEGIDFVVTWLDSSDLEWQKAFGLYKDEKNNFDSSFRNFNTLKYLFRGFEKYTPWVRKIHFVTSGHVPKWLNLDHPKINFVKHSDIFPVLSELPTFNSRAIEMCLHKIPDLSEKFVYFNDDMFIVNPISPTRFFKANLPKDFLIFYQLFNDGNFSHCLHTVMGVIHKEIKIKNRFIKRNFSKIFHINYGLKYLMINTVLAFVPQFSLFKIYHHPQPLLKSSILEVEEKYGELMKRTRSHKFKNNSDINQYIFRYWSLIKGKFIPYYPHDSFYLGMFSSIQVEDSISFLQRNSKINFVCFNDVSKLNNEEIELIKNLLIDYFQIIFPKKSSYEI